MKKLSLIVLILFLLIATLFTVGGASATGNTYYVSPTGDDANPGTLSSPFRTIQKAANVAVAGDTVYVRSGIYKEKVTIQNSGSLGYYITFSAYPGEYATIDGNGVSQSSWSGLIEIMDRNYIHITNLRIVNSANTGILIETANHITIDNNYIYNTVSSGIGIWNSTDVMVDNNEVVLACNDGNQEMVTVGNTNGFQISNNHIHHGGPGTNGGEGINIKEGSANGKVFGNIIHDIPNRLGIYVDAWNVHTYNIEIYQNIVHDNGSYGLALSSEAGGLLENAKVYNNIIYHNKINGIGFFDCCAELSPTHPVKDIAIVNNTIYNNGWGGWGGGIHIENPDIKNVIVRNNILSKNVSFQIALKTGVPSAELTVDHNLIDGFRNELGEIRGTSYIESDPLFVNASLLDFHLSAASPAINMGTALSAPSYDFDNILRLNGVDIGAYEYDISPTISSIQRANSNPTSAASVSFTVIFSKAVIGVDKNDFYLTTTGLSGASIANVMDSGDQTTYFVAVNTGSGSGSIRLDVNDTGTNIQDLAGKPLVSGFTSGETYTILKNNPPTDILLSHNSIDENMPASSEVGDFSTVDPDSGETFTYSFCGGSDDVSFQLNGFTLESAQTFDYETKNNYSICIRSTDSSALSTTKSFTIYVNNIDETAPPLLSYTGSTDSYVPPALVSRYRFVKANLSLLTDNTGQMQMAVSQNLTLNLFTDTSFLVTIQQTQQDGTTYSWMGSLQGTEVGQVIMVLSDGVFNAQVNTGSEIYQIQSFGNDLYLVTQINPNSFPEDHTPPTPEPTPSK